VDANAFIQQVFDDNPSPARAARRRLDEIAELERQYAEADNANDRRRLRREINKLYDSMGGYFKAVRD
jgi:predicted nucleic acid-binding protein